MRPLRRVSYDRRRSVDQQVQPVNRFLPVRTAPEPYRTAVLAAASDLLDDIGHAGKVSHRGRLAYMRGPVNEKVFAEGFRKNIPFASIGPFGLRKSALVTARRRGT